MIVVLCSQPWEKRWGKEADAVTVDEAEMLRRDAIESEEFKHGIWHEKTKCLVHATSI